MNGRQRRLWEPACSLTRTRSDGCEESLFLPLLHFVPVEPHCGVNTDPKATNDGRSLRASMSGFSCKNPTGCSEESVSDTPPKNYRSAPIVEHSSLGHPQSRAGAPTAVAPAAAGNRPAGRLRVSRPTSPLGSIRLRGFHPAPHRRRCRFPE